MIPLWQALLLILLAGIVGWSEYRWRKRVSETLDRMDQELDEMAEKITDFKRLIEPLEC